MYAFHIEMLKRNSSEPLVKENVATFGTLNDPSHDQQGHGW